MNLTSVLGITTRLLDQNCHVLKTREITIQTALQIVTRVKSKPPTHIRLLLGSLTRKAGSSIYDLNLANHFAQQNYRVSLIAFDSPQNCDSRIQRITIDVPKFNEKPVFWRFFSHFRARNVRKAIKRRELDRPDVVIATEHYSIEPHCHRFPDVPLIYTPHSLTVAKEIESRKFASKLSKWITRRHFVAMQEWAIHRCKAIVRFSQYSADELRSVCPSEVASKAIVNPMPVDIPTLDHKVSRASGSPIRLLFVGRLVASKGVDAMLSTLSEIRGKGWLLTIVGDGNRKETLETLTRQLNIQSQVDFVGASSDPDKWYSNADLFVFPSRLESTGLVVLEAMSHGVPCIALKSDGQSIFNANAELITHGEDGFLAASDGEFATLLNHAIQHPGLLKSMGSKARERVVKKNSWEVHMDCWAEVIESVARGED